MSPMILVAFLSLAELLVIALGVIVLLGMRLRSVSKQMQHLSKQSTKPVEPFDAAGHFEHALKNTEAHLNDADDQHSGLLRARMCYLQAELNAVAQKDYEAYWHSLYHGLAPLMPDVETTDTANPQQSTLAELDDPDPVADDENDIPTLEAQVTPSHEPSNEVKRLRKLIGRQHQTIEALKQSIKDRSLSEQDAHAIEQSIQEVEVAHAQLNLGLDSIERENGRLHEMLEQAPDHLHSNDAAADLAAEFDAEDVHTEDQEQPVIETPVAASVDEQLPAIEDPVAASGDDDNDDDLDLQKQSLNQEIAELGERLQQRTEDLLRLESLDMDLSHDEETEVAEDPEQVREEIEALSELLVARREELSQLAPDDMVDINAAAANDSDGAEAESFPEVNWEDALTEAPVEEEWVDSATEQADLVSQQEMDINVSGDNPAGDDSGEFPEINWDDAIAEIDTTTAENGEDEPVDPEEEIDIDALLAATDADDDLPLIPDIDDLSFTAETDADDAENPSDKEASA